MLASIAAWAGKSVLMSSPLGGLLKRIPRWVWLLLAGAVLVLFAMRWHAGKAEAFGAERYQAGYAAAQADAKAARDELERRNAKLAAELRSKNDAKLRDVARDADAVRLRGAGKAACSGPAFLPAAAGGRNAPDRSGDAALAEVPAGERVDLFGLPVAPTIDFAESHDAYRVEALGWREWHAAFTAEWEAYRKKVEAVATSR